MSDYISNNENKKEYSQTFYLNILCNFYLFI